MPKEKIPATNSDKHCQDIQPTDKVQLITDSKTPGLRLRVMPSGAKLWVFGYSVKVAPAPIKRKGDNFKSRTISLGPFHNGSKKAPANALTVTQARKQAAELKTRVNAGEDPALDKQRAIANRIAAEASRKTVRDVFEEWYSDEIIKQRTDKGAKEVHRMLAKDVLPDIGDLDIKAVSKGHIAAIAAKVQKRGDRIAHVVFSLTRQLMGFAVHRDYIELDPSSSIKKSKIGSPGNERERVLDDHELVELFTRLPESGLVGVNALAIPLQLATCCRIGELLKARWEHVDFDKREWFIPESKNGKAHTVYLSDFALTHFKQLYELSGFGEWLYPNRNGTNHLDAKTITKQIRDRQLPPEQIPKGRSKSKAQSLLLGERWTPHDLRRTGATIMASLQVSPDVIDRCLNHTEQNRITRTYQRYDYRPQMADAWALLGGKLIQLTEDSKKN